MGPRGGVELDDVKAGGAVRVPNLAPRRIVGGAGHREVARLQGVLHGGLRRRDVVRDLTRMGGIADVEDPQAGVDERAGDDLRLITIEAELCGIVTLDQVRRLISLTCA